MDVAYKNINVWMQWAFLLCGAAVKCSIDIHKIPGSSPTYYVHVTFFFPIYVPPINFFSSLPTHFFSTFKQELGIIQTHTNLL